MVSFEHVINDIECMVFADEFSEDPSVGVWLGPDLLWAERLDTNEEVPIPSEFEAEIIAIANEMFRDSLSDYLEWGASDF